MKTTAKSTVLVTGATSGIGRAASLQFAEAGYRVFATGRNPAALARLAEEASGRMETLVLDVTAARSIAEAREEVLGRTGGHGLDVLVNNAGFGVAAPVELVRDADLRAQFETNVFGLVSVTRAFLPEMRQRGSGRILNVSSINGRFTLPFLGIYDASKYAVESLSDAMRMELAGFGIEVVLIEPGPTRSDFAQRAGAILSTYATGASPYAPVRVAVEDAEQGEAHLHGVAVRRPCDEPAGERSQSLRVEVLPRDDRLQQSIDHGECPVLGEEVVDLLQRTGGRGNRDVSDGFDDGCRRGPAILLVDVVPEHTVQRAGRPPEATLTAEALLVRKLRAARLEPRAVGREV